MPSEEVAEYHHQLTFEIERLLPAVARLEEEAIHQFRLCVKRLRSFYQWAETLDPEFSAKEKAAQVRALFKAAGRVRDAQVQRRLASHWQESTRISLDGYLNHLGELESEHGAPLREACHGFPEDVLSRRRQEVSDLLEGAASQDLPSALDKHLKMLVERLHEMTGQEGGGKAHSGDDDPHRVRILTKRIRYASEAALSAHLEEAGLKALIESMKALHDPLGDWHDRRVASRFAQKYLESGPPEAEGERLKLFVQSMKEEEGGFLDAFRENWQAFVKSSRDAILTSS
ncbi:MAG TPA: CHAD domain-containing protein [Acidobacteriota bacterium]|nr:CHAD domain-containing protein [Acidobacteriota bacterium]